MYLVFISCLVLCSFKHAAGQEGPVVETPVGAVRGVRDAWGNFSSFKGIPYARVNTENVFGDALPYPNFEGTFEANDDSLICPQIEEFNFTSVGTLDCLRLHIYRPDAADHNKLPVMFYIYGGGFTIGFAGSFILAPEYIVRHDVILVTFNYRLGPYGFLCSDVPQLAGNQGLKDQRLALRWVKDNIAAFGGDPDQITLFANSAGAAAIDLHYRSPDENLFKNAIMQSGTFLTVGLREPDPTEPFRLAEIMGLQTTNLDEALLYLSSLDPLELIEKAEMNGFSISPCIENEYSGIENFITQHPINVPPKSKGHNVIIGYNKDEELEAFYSVETTADAYYNYVKTQLNGRFHIEDTNIYNELESFVIQFYIGHEPFTVDAREQFTELGSDLLFVHPAYRSLELHLDNGAPKAYMYVFSHDGDRNFVKRKNNLTLPGVTHADEIGYLFDMDYIPETPSPEDQLIIDSMTAMWTNFAKYDDPTPQSTELLPVKWEAITQGSPYHYIDIATTLTTGMRHHHRRMVFLDLLYNTYADYVVGVTSASYILKFSPVILIVSFIVSFL